MSYSYLDTASTQMIHHVVLYIIGSFGWSPLESICHVVIYGSVHVIMCMHAWSYLLTIYYRSHNTCSQTHLYKHIYTWMHTCMDAADKSNLYRSQVHPAWLWLVHAFIKYYFYSYIQSINVTCVKLYQRSRQKGQLSDRYECYQYIWHDTKCIKSWVHVPS